MHALSTLDYSTRPMDTDSPSLLPTAVDQPAGMDSACPSDGQQPTSLVEGVDYKPELEIDGP